MTENEKHIAELQELLESWLKGTHAIALDAAIAALEKKGKHLAYRTVVVTTDWLDAVEKACLRADYYAVKDLMATVRPAAPRPVPTNPGWWWRKEPEWKRAMPVEVFERSHSPSACQCSSCQSVPLLWGTRSNYVLDDGYWLGEVEPWKGEGVAP